MDYIEIENADGSRKWKIEGAPFNDWVSSDLPSDWHVIHEETSRMQKRKLLKLYTQRLIYCPQSEVILKYFVCNL